MKVKTCCFVGHSRLYNKEEIEPKLKKAIINLIENHGVTKFYSGGKGDFDWLCVRCVDQLRNDYQFIESYLILSYIPNKNDYSNGTLKILDGTIYPDIEKTPPRYAILKRNEWMIDNSDFLISYVEHGFGGACKTLEYAKRKGHIIINNIT